MSFGPDCKHDLTCPIGRSYDFQNPTFNDASTPHYAFLNRPE